jgi:hypothetical protein
MMSSDGRRPTNTGALAFFHFARTFNRKSINGNSRSVNENTQTSGFLISGKLLVIAALGGDGYMGPIAVSLNLPPLQNRPLCQE